MVRITHVLVQTQHSGRGRDPYSTLGLPMGKSGAGDGTCELLRHVDARHSQTTLSLVRLNRCVYIMLSSSTLVGTLIDYILAQELATY